MLNQWSKYLDFFMFTPKLFVNQSCILKALTVWCIFLQVSAEQQFSMPIQCTDDTGEQVEEPSSASSRPEVEDSLTSGAVESRGASPEDGDFMDDVRFPPPTDSEYEFLHSAPDRSVPLQMPRKDLPEAISTVMEESYSSYSVSTPASHPLSASASHEGVRGPQQVRANHTPFWIVWIVK